MTDQGNPVENNLHSSAPQTRRNVLKTLGIAGAAVSITSSGAGAKRSNDVLPPNPGPEWLYEDAPEAPHFQNEGVWNADPLYVMGSQAHVEGEYIYQGFNFDDFGAKTGHPETHPHTGAEVAASEGDLHYPTDVATYGHNAADLLEFRATTQGNDIKYRITLNTMLEPDVAGIAIGINTDRDSTTGSDDWDYGIGELGELGLDHVVVTWGTGAELLTRTDTGVERTEIQSSVDLERNQIELTVPLNPRQVTWRHYLVTGLFDTDEMAFKQIQEVADEENSGGAAGQNPPPVFDVGFRHHAQEPVGRISNDPGTTDQLRSDLENGDVLVWGEWRDYSQAAALAEGDISEFYADIDFAKVQRKWTERDVPDSGLINRVYGSRFDFGEGVVDGDGPLMPGRIQPYALYIPDDYSPDEPTPLFILLHGGSANHNQIPVASPNFLRQFGEERGALVLSPLARGLSYGYDDEGELDVLEALSDVDTHYNVDFDQLMVGGPSMGGTGTFNLSGRYPDLFNGAFSIVSGSSSDQLIDNLRHVPMLLWNGAIDQLVIPTVGGASAHRRLLDRNYRHEWGVFPAYGHARLTIEDEWEPARDYLDEFDDPPEYPWHVTYHSNAGTSNPQWGLTHDGAYWISDIRATEGTDTGRVDVKDRAAGRSDPNVNTYQEEREDPDYHVASGLEWRDPVMSTPASNRLEVDLQDVESVRIWIDVTDLDPTKTIDIATDSTNEATIVLVSQVGEKEVTVPVGSTEQSITI